MNGILYFILIVFGVLQIILFFKIWGMTNDTEKIKSMLNLRNRLSLFQNIPPKCKDSMGNVYYVRGVFEDTIYCVRNENDENAIALKANEVSFIID